MFSSVQAIVSSPLVELIAHHRLLPLNLDSMACEDVEDQEVALRLIDESLAKMPACLCKVLPGRVLKIVHFSL